MSTPMTMASIFSVKREAKNTEYLNVHLTAFVFCTFSAVRLSISKCSLIQPVSAVLSISGFETHSPTICL
jgi:hypothetical protein